MQSCLHDYTNDSLSIFSKTTKAVMKEETHRKKTKLRDPLILRILVVQLVIEPLRKKKRNTKKKTKPRDPLFF